MEARAWAGARARGGRLLGGGGVASMTELAGGGARARAPGSPTAAATAAATAADAPARAEKAAAAARYREDPAGVAEQQQQQQQLDAKDDPAAPENVAAKFAIASGWIIAEDDSCQAWRGALVENVDGSIVIFRRSGDGAQVALDMRDELHRRCVRAIHEASAKSDPARSDPAPALDREPLDLEGGSAVEVRRADGTWASATVETIDPSKDELIVSFRSLALQGVRETIELKHGDECRVRAAAGGGPVVLNGIVYDTRPPPQDAHAARARKAQKRAERRGSATGRSELGDARDGVGPGDPYVEHVWYREAASQGWYDATRGSASSPVDAVTTGGTGAQDSYLLRNRGWRQQYAMGLRGGMRGLANMGNTCYMNSVLQCLMHCGILAEAIMEMPDGTTAAGSSLVHAFQECLVEHWKSAHEMAFRPHTIKALMSRTAPQFAGFEQHDAQEFLVFFLDALHEELNEVKQKKYETVHDDARMPDVERAQIFWANYEASNRSVIKRTFVGQLCSRVTCRQCGHMSVVFDPFWNLSVPIPDSAACTLTDCLRAFVAPEELAGENSYFCARCKTRTNCTKQMTLYRCPDVVVIHLKRFQTRGASQMRMRSTRGSGFSKLATSVTPPLGDLDLRPFCAPEAHHDTFGYPESLLYNLIGVVNHYGASGTHGHYTADCVDPKKDGWLHFDDSAVRATRPDNLGHRDGYVMLFARTTA